MGPVMMGSTYTSDPVFPFEIWTLVDQYIPWRTRIALTSTCSTLRVLLSAWLFESVTLTLVDSPMGMQDYSNQRLLRKIQFLTSPKIAPTVKFCRLNFDTRRIPSIPLTSDQCTPLFKALAHFKNLTDLDCFRILFDESHVEVMNSLAHITNAEFTECQWAYRYHIPFDNRMRLRHLLVDQGPNKHRYQWLFNTHPDFLVSLVLTSGMPADFISGFLPPLPNLESLEINGIATLHPEFPIFMSLCPGLIELRITTDSLLPLYIRAAEDVMRVIPPECIPDLRVYEGPAEFLPALTKGRLVTHVGAYASPLFMDTFTISVGSAFKKLQVKSLKLRVPKVTEQVLALISYFKASLAVEIVVTNEEQPLESRQTYQDILQALDKSIFPPPPYLEYLSIAEESTVWGTPAISHWYQTQQRHSTTTTTTSASTTTLNFTPFPESQFVKRCPNLRYAMLSTTDSGIITAWNPRMNTPPTTVMTIKEWQRQRLRLFEPLPYHAI